MSSSDKIVYAPRAESGHANSHKVRSTWPKVIATESYLALALDSSRSPSASCDELDARCAFPRFRLSTRKLLFWFWYSTGLYAKVLVLYDSLELLLACGDSSVSDTYAKVLVLNNILELPLACDKYSAVSDMPKLGRHQDFSFKWYFGVVAGLRWVATGPQQVFF